MYKKSKVMAVRYLQVGKTPSSANKLKYFIPTDNLTSALEIAAAFHAKQKIKGDWFPADCSFMWVQKREEFGGTKFERLAEVFIPDELKPGLVSFHVVSFAEGEQDDDPLQYEIACNSVEEAMTLAPDIHAAETGEGGKKYHICGVKDIQEVIESRFGGPARCGGLRKLLVLAEAATPEK